MVTGAYFFYWNTTFWLDGEKKGLSPLCGLEVKGCQYKMKKKLNY